jgi:hypothetical protein
MLSAPVFSVNKGVRSLSFSPIAGQDTIAEIDAVLARTLGLPATFPSYLMQLMLDTIIAGRESEIGRNATLKRITVGALDGD